jgi:hypothetical protein
MTRLSMVGILDLIPLRAGGVQYAIGKLSMRAIISVQTSSRSEVYTISYEPAKLQGILTLVILGLPLGGPGTKSHSDVTPVGRCRVYYMGEGGGFPQVRAVVSLVNPKSPVARPSTKGAPALC